MNRPHSALTPLERELQNPKSARPTPLRVFEIARQTFMANQRLDMGELAATAGVSRATLSRWVGSRDKILGEILYSIADGAFSAAEREVNGAGVDRVLSVLNHFFLGVLAPGPYRAFVSSSPQLALRLCASKDGPVQERLIIRIEGLLASEGIESDSNMSLRDLAYALLRIGESFVYNDVITGEAPQLDAARSIWERILRTVD